MKVLFNIVAVLLVWQNHKSCKAKDLFGQGQGLLLKAKAKDLTFKGKDSKFVLENIPRTSHIPKAKDNNTAWRSVSYKLQD